MGLCWVQWYQWKERERERERDKVSFTCQIFVCVFCSAFSDYISLPLPLKMHHYLILALDQAPLKSLRMLKTHGEIAHVNSTLDWFVSNRGVVFSMAQLEFMGPTHFSISPFKLFRSRFLIFPKEMLNLICLSVHPFVCQLVCLSIPSAWLLPTNLPA
jgi:hypothetical protein